jgi:hypothetical protein
VPIEAQRPVGTQGPTAHAALAPAPFGPASSPVPANRSTALGRARRAAESRGARACGGGGGGARQVKHSASLASIRTGWCCLCCDFSPVAQPDRCSQVNEGRGYQRNIIMIISAGCHCLSAGQCTMSTIHPAKHSHRRQHASLQVRQRSQGQGLPEAVSLDPRHPNVRPGIDRGLAVLAGLARRL